MEQETNQTQPKPIFGLIAIIEDENTARELTRFAQFAQLDTVEQLVLYSRPSLEAVGVTQATIGNLESTLKDKYQLTFANQTTESLPTLPVGEIKRDYEIADKGDYLLVNGKEITFTKKSLPKEDAIAIYTRFAAGENREQIAAALNKSPLTIDTYLRKADIIPQAKKHGYAPSSHVNASGAPPTSTFARLRQYRP